MATVAQKPDLDRLSSANALTTITTHVNKRLVNIFCCLNTMYEQDSQTANLNCFVFWLSEHDIFLLLTQDDPQLKHKHTYAIAVEILGRVFRRDD